MLISPDFLASDYCYGIEMQRALERQKAREAHVIPILLRPVDWESSPFASLQCLPPGALPITQWANRDEALVAVVKGIRALIEADINPGPSPPPPDPINASRDQNRHRMLERVQTTWVSGVLDHSLHDAALIALGLHEEPGMLANPWRDVVQEVDRPAQPLPAGTTITEVYHNAGGALLILGEPGAGKTTLLLELARVLLICAQADQREPIPVVFNLSSWSQKKYASLEPWLVEELNIRYQVPPRLGQTWVDSDKLLLLLDGLDEVATEQQSACIKANNSYRQVHPLVPVVTCVRRDVYLNQEQRLELQRAVSVQSLTAQQIDDYLTSMGGRVAAVSAALRDDPDLQLLVTTPLMLSIVILVYQGGTLERGKEDGSTEERQEQLFASYVQHMLKRRGVRKRRAPEQTIHWLSSLANQMKRESQTIFYLEQMQPEWLSANQRPGLYNWLGVRLPGMLIGALVGLAVIAFLNFAVLSTGIVSILLCGLLGELWSEGRAVQRFPISEGKARNMLWLRILQWLGTGFLISLIAAYPFYLELRLQYKSANFSLLESQQQRLVLSGLLSSGLGIGLWNILLQLLRRQSSTRENSHSALTTIWQRLARLINSPGGGSGLLTGLLFVVISGIVSTVVYGLIFGPVFGPVTGLLFGLTLGLLFGLLGGLLVGPSSGFLSALLMGKDDLIQPVDQLNWSWENLRMTLFSKRHIRPTLVVGLTFGLAGMLIIVLLQVLIARLTFSPVYLQSGLLIGLINGLSSGLAYWLLLGFWQGVSSTTIEAQHRVVPNQGIRRSAYNGLVLGLVSAMIVGLTALLRQWLTSNLYAAQSVGQLARLYTGGISGNPEVWLRSGLLAGLFAGLVAGLLNGGLTCLRHYILRFLLWRAGSVPWRYVQFLDYATERILLRKAGGGYIFIHPLLLDYFASLEKKES